MTPNTSNDLDEISIWVEANRDVSPAKWVDEIWPHIEQALNKLIAARVAEEFEKIPPLFNGDWGHTITGNYIVDRIKELKGKP